MEIVDIFVVEKGSLYAVMFDGFDCDEFALAFRNWGDIEYLEDFFESHKYDLLLGDYKDIAVEEAILKTVEESLSFESKIRKVAQKGSFANKTSLQDLIFYPLKKNDTKYLLQESKAYGSNEKSWLRIYAVRISPNRYVVSGSAIKLRDTMRDAENTKKELLKLELTSRYLKDLGYLTDDDFGYIDFK